METYLRRLYEQKREEEQGGPYPVWDYRSRRSTVSTTLSSGDGSALSGTGSSRSEVEMSESGSSVSSGSGSDMDTVALRDPARLTFELLVDPHEVYPLLDLYEPLIGWIDPDLRLFHAGERPACSSCGNANTNTNTNNPHTHSGGRKGILVNKHHCEHRYRTLSGVRNWNQDSGSELFRENRTSEEVSGSPPFSVILFLYEEDVCSGGRVDCVRRCLERGPWRFHHSEKASRRNLNLHPKSLDYFFISEDLPLWSIRQVHYGKEHIRIVVQTREETWTDMVEFYKLILGFEPDFLREDFCLFTVHSQIHFDIQLALKRGQRSCGLAQSARLHFKVADLGRLVPLFPNVCQPVSDCLWLTTDHDGNEVVLDLTACSLGGASSAANSDRASSESCASASSSDVSFDSHDSVQSHDSGNSGDFGHSRGSSSSSSSRSSNSEESIIKGQKQPPAPRSTLDTFKRRKSLSGIITARNASDDKRKSQRRVTFCFDDVPPASSSSMTSPPPRLTPVPPPRVPSPSSPPFAAASPALSLSPSPQPETQFTLRFDTCPTAPLSPNNRREEQIGFYV